MFFFCRIFVDAIAIWQSSSEIGNVIVSATLNALGSCKSFSNNMFMLMETTVFHYFRCLGIISHIISLSLSLFHTHTFSLPTIYMLNIFFQNRKRAHMHRPGQMLWNVWDHHCHHLICNKCSMVNIYCAFIFR